MYCTSYIQTLHIHVWFLRNVQFLHVRSTHVSTFILVKKAPCQWKHIWYTNFEIQASLPSSTRASVLVCGPGPWKLKRNSTPRLTISACMTQQAGEEGGLNQTYRGTGGWGDAVVLHQLNHWNYIFDNYFQLIEAQAPTKVLITCGQRFLVHLC